MAPVLPFSACKGRFLAVLDGPCGSGKTTVSKYLEQQIPNLRIVHMDDYYVPIVRKTPERLSIPGGNADVERLVEEVLTPYLEGRDALVRPYLAHEDRFLPSWTLPADVPLLIEGSYSGLPQISSHADFRIFLTIDETLQKERILRRNGPDVYKKFVSMWIPLEKAYHAHYHLPTESWLVYNQDELQMLMKG